MIYTKFTPPSKNSYIVLIRKYVGVCVIILIYAAFIISNWSVILKSQPYDSVSMVISLYIILCVVIFIGAILAMYISIVKSKKQNFRLLKILNFIYDNIVYPALQEFSANITGFLIANLIMGVLLYAEHWDEIVTHWNEKIYAHNIMSATNMIILGAIILPIIISFLCELCHIAILSLRSKVKTLE